MGSRVCVCVPMPVPGSSDTTRLLGVRGLCWAWPQQQVRVQVAAAVQCGVGVWSLGRVWLRSSFQLRQWELPD